MINIRMQHKDVQRLTPKIAVIGVGGAGGNAVNNMISSGLQGVEFMVCNTDAQALEGSLCETRLQLGVTVTGGLGAGAKPEVGRAAAEESLDEVMQYVEGANMAFITAGMGGGTGTGAAPVIARACRDKGVLTVGVVTKPFHFEGSLRMKMAEAGIAEMQQYVDTLIVIPNQNLFRVANEKTTFAEAFRMADSVLQSGVRGVTDLMVMPGLINLDFADIRSAMLEMGKAMMGTGEATGERRATEAAEKAINNPLLDDVSMKGARGVIINVTGGYDMTLFEVDEACNRIRDEVDPNANIIFGSTFEEAMDGVMRVSVVATGIDAAEAKGRKPHGNGVSLNAITAQQMERKIERVQPQTAETVQPAAAAPVAPVSRQASYVPTPASAAAAAQHLPLNIRPAGVSGPLPGFAASVQKDEPDADMFAHQDYVAQPMQASAGGSVPRGSVQGDSFIPPSPVTTEYGHSYQVDGYGPQFAQGGAALAARRPAYAEQPPMQTAPSPSAGLTLRPPVPGSSTATQQKKRSPSLLDRLTGPLRGGHSAPAVDAPAAPPVQRPQQGSLNIEPTKPSDNIDDQLDIPAFLRRQAS